MRTLTTVCCQPPASRLCREMTTNRAAGESVETILAGVLRRLKVDESGRFPVRETFVGPAQPPIIPVRAMRSP
jgi:hypothetical protein